MSQPRIEFDPELPITSRVSEIAELIEHNPVVIVAGETGSGKTTQLPKICLLAGRRAIAHTQPRRIAASSVAQRIAEECGVELGEFIGYQVRFTRKVTKVTRIKLMTDGILLSELAHDRNLTRYDTIIIDEAHERSLNIDFLLGYLKQLLPKRPELRVIVTSATIDTHRFSQHFDDAPIVEVSGRTYPVEIRYRPLKQDQDFTEGIAAAMEEIATEPIGGDVLVFLSGEREIRDAAHAIEALGLPGWETIPLYARLAAADQQRVFAPHQQRRVILATNVAETSLTVPGIRYVIDVGTARISRYSVRSKVQRLPIEEISQASANQRAGRCGRLSDGVAIRLYSQENFQAREEFTAPEILRTNLATVIVQMAQAGLGDIASFPFVEAPASGLVNDGLRILYELGAIAHRRRHERLRLTRTGRILAKLPVDPTMGRMLLEGSRRGCLREVIIIVAGLTVPDIRERPLENQQRADELHRRFHTPPDSPEATATAEKPKRHTVHTGTHKIEPNASSSVPEGGDFEVLLNLWHYLARRRKEFSGNQFRRMFRDEFLHYVRYREWQDLVTQLQHACREAGLRETSGSMPDIITSVLSGLLSNIGAKQTRRADRDTSKRRRIVEFNGARGVKFAIQPGSSLARKPPDLVAAFELVETSRLWARTVTAIRPEWVEAVASHVMVRTVSEPTFESRTGTVIATEQLSLFGVPIVTGRRTSYAHDHPEQAREIFIRQGLVEQQWHTRNELVESHRFALAEAEKLTDRMRRPDLLISDDDYYAFWDRHLPPDVVSGASFERFVKHHDVSALRLSPADLMADPGAVVVSEFPDHWEIAGHRLPVSYVFDPGAGHDGVTVEVPIEALGQLPSAPFTWQVPGLRKDLITALIRSLPKRIRTQFVPTPQWAARALAELKPSDQASLPEALASLLQRHSEVAVAASDFDLASVDSHLRPTFVIEDRGQEIGRGADLDALRTDLAPQVSAKLTEASKQFIATGQRSWSFGQIPETVAISRAVEGFPHLVDEGASVGVAVAEQPQRARLAHAKGLRRLLVLVNPSPIRWVVSHLGNEDKLALGGSAYPSVPELLADAWLAASGYLLKESTDPTTIRDPQAFTALAEQIRAEAPEATLKVVAEVAGALRTRAKVEHLLGLLDPRDPVRRDIEEQVANLVFAYFISATDARWLPRIQVYLEAATLRLEQLNGNRVKDERAMAQVEQIEADYAALCDRFPPGALPPDVEEVAFLIEELRVSLFAQRLKTAMPISGKRIRQAMQRL